jgi:lipopolysaccharide exporter
MHPVTSTMVSTQSTQKVSTDASESLAVRATRGAAWVLLAFLAYRLLGFFTNLILARLLTPAEFGLVSLALLMINASALLQDVGVPTAIVYSGRDIKQMAGTALTINLAVSTALCILVVLGAPLLARYGHDAAILPITIVLALGLIVTAAGSVQSALLVKGMAFRKKFITDVTPLALSGLTSIAMALSGFGAWSLVSGQTIRAASSTLLLWGVSSIRPRPTFKRSVALELLQYGRHVSLSSAIGFCASNVDNFIIGGMLGTNQLGLYVMAFTMTQLVTGAMGQVVASVAFPAYSQMRERRDAYFHAFAGTFKTILTVGSPLSLLLGVGAPIFIPLVFGEKWAGSVSSIQWLSILTTIQAIDYNSAAVYKGLGRPQWLWRLTLVKLAVLAPMMLFLLRYGIAGIAAAHALVALGLFPFSMVMVAKVMGVDVRAIWRLMAPSLIGVASMGVVLGLGEAFSGLRAVTASPVGFLAEAALALGVFLLVLMRTDQQYVARAREHFSSLVRSRLVSVNGQSLEGAGTSTSTAA